MPVHIMGWIVRVRGENSIVTVIEYILQFIPTFHFGTNVVFVGPEDVLFIFDSFVVFQNFVFLLILHNELHPHLGVEFYC